MITPVIFVYDYEFYSLKHVPVNWAMSTPVLSLTMMLKTLVVRPDFRHSVYAYIVSPLADDIKLQFTVMATDGECIWLEDTARAKSARVNITPPITPPIAFL